MKQGDVVQLDRAWRIGARVGSGGFGQVFEAASDDVTAVAKFVPKDRGADRELLFVEVGDAANVVPVIDSGETPDAWVLVMPRAERSLREHLESCGALPVADAVAILQDIAEALTALDGRVVHRDLKPENILYLHGRWCLADFGISRYAEATTASDTKKHALSAPYAGPERFRGERATAATDIYSFGIIAYELVAGERPFPGPQFEDYHEQHLGEDAPALSAAPGRLASVVGECLYKSPSTRPSAANLLARLRKIAETPVSVGLARLQEAHVSEVQRRSEAARAESVARTERERRDEAARDAQRGLAAMTGQLCETIADAAPTVSAVAGHDGALTLTLGSGSMYLTQFSRFSGNWGAWETPLVDVIAHAALSVRAPATRHGYTGRSHSLWFCDAHDEGRYQWFETAFMELSLGSGRARSEAPFALEPGHASAKALWRGMAEFQVAWPFTPLDSGDLDEFLDRWADWFARAALGRLEYPSHLPERPTEGTWRR